jgi:hypothetical protein
VELMLGDPAILDPVQAGAVVVLLLILAAGSAEKQLKV